MVLGARFRAGAIALGGVTLNACVEQPVVCAPLYPAAVAVVVRDSISGTLLTDSAQGFVVHGELIDPMVQGPALQFGDSVLIGGSQAGIVEVHVVRIGYQPWTRGGVAASLSGDPCPVFATQVLTAWLQR